MENEKTITNKDGYAIIKRLPFRYEGTQMYYIKLMGDKDTIFELIKDVEKNLEDDGN